MNTRFVWIRHAPARGVARRFCGRIDPPADIGDRAALRRVLTALPARPILLSSPLRRAVDTADALCALGLRPWWRGIEPAFAEQDFGRFDGLTYDEAARRFPEAYAALWADPVTTAPPDGEAFADVVGRVAAASARRAAGAAGSPVVVVAHAGTLRAVLALRALSPAEALARPIRHFGTLVIEAGRVVADTTGSADQKSDDDAGREEQPVLR